MAMGADREPGDTHANSTPWAASSSTKVAAKDWATSLIGWSRCDSGAWGRQAELLCRRRRRPRDAPPRLHAKRPQLARAHRQDAAGVALDRPRPARPRRDPDPPRRVVLDGGLHARPRRPLGRARGGAIACRGLLDGRPARAPRGRKEAGSAAF